MDYEERSGNTLLRAGIVIAVIAVIVFVFVGVFRIQNVSVVGNSRYSAEEIQSALIYDFPTKNTLLFAWKYKNAAYEERTPYLNTVQAKIISPASVQIIVQEKKLTGRVEYNGQYVYFDENGTVLEITDTLYDGAALITGIGLESPTLYQKLPVTNTALLRTMLSIAQLMKGSDLSVGSINFDENLNITVLIDEIVVELGQDEYLEEKVSNLMTIYPKIAGQPGTLNMAAFTGKNEGITFTNRVEAEPEPAQETDADGGVVDYDENAWEQQTPSDVLVGNPSQQEDTGDTSEDTPQETYSTTFMVFDSSGTLRYDARVVNGQVLDGYGNVIDGCYINESGNVVDAYWNEIDPSTGQAINL